MKNKWRHIIRTKPVFLLLLSLFFVLHGFTENYNFIPVKDAGLLTGLYWLASFVLAGIGWLLYRNGIKACLFAFCLMAFHFFFGSVHDFLRKVVPDSLITKYLFILPAVAIVFIILFWLLKKSKATFTTTTFYLNSLLVILVAIDLVMLGGKIASASKKKTALPEGLTACAECPKPDIYFIVADEYAGNTELKDLFSFDNSDFQNELAKRNFHIIPESFSNYNYTPFSVASILNMDYLDLRGKDRAGPDLTYSYESIRDNKALRFLRYHGYRFYNHSIFDFEGQPGRRLETFLPARTRLITAQTFLSRVDKEIRFNLATKWKSKSELRRLTYYFNKNNENIYSLTWNLAGKKTAEPKVVYTHLMMPHYPYYFDKNGKEQPFETLTEGNQVNKKAYIEYLQYCNKKFLALVDHLLQSSARPPVIILMGDHGFRHFTETVEPKYHFLNMAGIHIPSRDYADFRDSLSGVNLFRVLFNKEFRQQLPYLKDSSTYLSD